MKTVILGLGSNKSFNNLEPIELLRNAVFELEKIVQDIECSSIYRTKPMYVEDQEYFYNMVILCSVEDNKSAHKLLEEIHSVESLLGRNRSKEIRFGPRSIDIDIEYFDDMEVNTPDLEIPHPRLKERAFVLQPLLEILEKCSDVIREEKVKEFESYLNLILEKDIELYMDSKNFLLLRVNKEVQNGNTDTRSSKDKFKNL